MRAWEFMAPKVTIGSAAKADQAGRHVGVERPSLNAARHADHLAPCHRVAAARVAAKPGRQPKR